MRSHPFDRFSAALAILVLTGGIVLAVQQAGLWTPELPALAAIAACSIAVAVIVGWPRRASNAPLTTTTPGQAIDRIPDQNP